jgi:hypothetical protein
MRVTAAFAAACLVVAASLIVAACVHVAWLTGKDNTPFLTSLLRGDVEAINLLTYVTTLIAAVAGPSFLLAAIIAWLLFAILRRFGPISLAAFMLAGLAVAMLVIAVLALADLAIAEIPIAILPAFWPEIASILLGAPLGALVFWMIARRAALAA